jgi:hypothetical protein
VFKRSRGAIHISRTRSERGQGLVEFGLVLPLLLVFLLGVADFGRVFADGIALEAAARNSAEAAAQEYLQLCAKYVDVDTSGTCALGLQPTDYDTLHALALEVGCRESQRMTNRVAPGGNCTNPIIAVCIHDDVQGDASNCGQEAPVPGGSCDEMDTAWSSTRFGPLDGRPYAEVRMCYQFDPLFSFAIANFGTVWLQKANSFAVTNY